MGIFDKVKNIFYDEEEEEEVVEKVKPTKETEEKEKNENLNQKIDDTIISERDLFKTTRDFKFPIVFDDDDFVQSDLETYIENGLTEEKKPSIKKEKRKEEKVVKKEEEQEDEKKNFTPSPIISPVYGILDKNYKKEDVTSKDNSALRPSRKLDIDAVRNKAFGTLMDDLDAMIVDDKEHGIFYTGEDEKETEEKNLENTLEESILASIPDSVDAYSAIGEVEDDYNNNDIEHTFDARKMNVAEEEEKRKILEDTVEHDLFNLIDAMYEKMEKEDVVEEEE